MQFTTPHYMARDVLRASIKEALTGKFSYTRGRLPRVWENLQRDEEIGWVFKHFEYKNLVRLVPEPDDLPTDDLFGNCFDECHADTIPGGLRELRAQEKRALDRVNEDGQRFIHTDYLRVGYASQDPDGWHQADGIGGFVGDDFYGSGYEPDLYRSALEGLFESRGGRLPEYVPSKTGAWSKAVLMGWEMIRGNNHEN